LWRQRELGFIVVQIDGMGTSNRSKAFHDLAWQNIGDAGFPDRMLWHKAVAARYSCFHDFDEYERLVDPRRTNRRLNLLFC
jgi:hypothetical protein